jgi:hypothetical protein
MKVAEIPSSALSVAVTQTVVTISGVCLGLIGKSWGVLGHYFIFSGAVLLPLLIVSVISSYGLWTGKRYGWLAGIGADGIGGLLLLCFVNPILGLVLLAVAGSFFLGGVRNFYSRPQA